MFSLIQEVSPQPSVDVWQHYLGYAGYVILGILVMLAVRIERTTSRILDLLEGRKR